MLTYLRIENFALIDSLELELQPGLTVLSGETGAGKSIILAAMGLILGDRAAADLIRQGREQAVIEALFVLDGGPAAAAILADEADLEPDEGGEVAIRRVVSRQGRNRVQVCGALANLGLLGRLGPELVSVVGQHESASLLRPEEHLALLDAFGGLDDARAEVGRAVAEVRRLDRLAADTARELEDTRKRRKDLERMVEELDAAELRPDEEDELRAERDLLANSEQIGRLSRQAYEGLYASDGSVLDQMSTIRGLLEQLGRLDPAAAEMAARGEELFYLLEDISTEVRDYEARINFDPHRLDWLEGRLHQLQRLCRKYGGDVPGAMAMLGQARRELEGLDTGDQILRELAAQRQKALDAALELAQALSRARERAADELARAVEAELAVLGMEACRFAADFLPPGPGAIDTPHGPLAAQGLESCQFLIAPNPGEGLRRLARIASGGELSRLLLALRGVVARRMGMPTMVFDEVDAGVGGVVGAAIGRKLAALARGAQVICITHLPQIAAWADQHIAVRKVVSQGRTSTTLVPLDQEGRLAEMARMLAGPGGEASAAEHAAGLLAAALREKNACD